MNQKKSEGRRGDLSQGRSRLALWIWKWGADLLLLAGAGCISAGAGWICPPAGLITAGVLLIAGGVLLARGGEP